MEKPNSILNSKEKVVGLITGLMILAGIGVGLYYILPPLLLIITNLLRLGLLVGGTLLVTVALFKARKLIRASYEVFIQKLWRALANNDPIALMKIKVKDWWESLEVVNKRIQTLRGSEALLEAACNDNADDAEQFMQLAKKAASGDKGKQSPQAILKTRQALRRLQANNQLVPRLQAVKQAIALLEKLYERWELDIKDLEDEIEVRSISLKAVRDVSSALEAAESIMNGTPDQRAMEELANQAYAELVSQHVGKVKRFLSKSKGWIEESDLKEAVLTDEGLKLLDYDEKSFKQLVDFKQQLENDPVLSQKVVLPISKNADAVIESFSKLK
ncbi:hypothetical protein IPJ63_02590 [Candidatus Nomurabacteria bacterium]|nr:MAG: hypothetical protein IPJ63_02590 [Candidatus Nomurabacteria bacterium]